VGRGYERISSEEWLYKNIVFIEWGVVLEIFFHYLSLGHVSQCMYILSLLFCIFYGYSHTNACIFVYLASSFIDDAYKFIVWLVGSNRKVY